MVAPRPSSSSSSSSSLFSSPEYGKAIFIVGCGHSGTSLLLKILGSHPQVYAIPVETQLFTAGKRSPPPVSLVEDEIKKWIAIGEKDKSGSRARIWVEKTPGHVCAIPYLLHTFPLSKIIVIVRDGRDVVSGLRWDRGYDLTHASNRWVNDNLAALNHFLTADDDNRRRIYFLKYEELVVAPQITVRALCSFLNLPFIPSMLEEFQKTTFSNGGGLLSIHSKRRANQLQQELYDGRGRWQQQLTAHDIQKLKPEISALLVLFGYNTSSPW
jgi:hypothetical protein